MKYEYIDSNGNRTVRAKSLDETLKEIVSAVNSIGLMMTMDDKELAASFLQIAEVIEDYRLEYVHEKEQSEEHGRS